MSDEEQTPDKKERMYGSKDRMFPGDQEKVTQAFSKAVGNANHAAGNIGDSLESRLMTSFLGGGSDEFAGHNGYIGEYLGESHFGGEGGTARSPGGRRRYGKQGETKEAWMKMKIVNGVYENDGQVASIIDLMADFATEGIQFIHGKETVQKFYEAWSQKVKLKKVFRQSIIELLNAGNHFMYRIFARLDASEERAMKTFTIGQRVGEKFVITDGAGEQTLVDPKIEYDSSLRFIFEAAKGKELTDDEMKAEVHNFVVERLKSNAAKIIDKDIKPGAKKIVPWKYIAMNPCQIIPDDTDGGWIYLLTKEEVQKLLKRANVSFNENAKSLTVTMPSGVSGRIGKSRHSGFFAEMKLQDERLVVLQYNKKDWKKWGTGLTWKAMPTITFKNTLRQMENKTAKAGINTVILWKIGDHKEGLIPIMEDYERLADMLKAPASTLNVIWHSAIEADVVQPKIKEIFDPKRWEELRKEVTSQFGITQSVVTGEGGNFSSSFISVQGLLEKLETLRELLMEEWLMPEVFLIQKAMGFRKLPKVTFGKMSLRDQNAENNFLMGLYDRGLVSDTSLYEVMKRDTEIERERLVNENEWENKNDFPRRGPFIKDGEQHELDKQRLALDSKNSEEERQVRREEMDFSQKQDQKKLDEDIKLKKQTQKDNLALKKQSQKKSTQKGPNGRPPGSGGKPQKNKRPSKPKNIARTDVEAMVKILDKNAKDYLVAKAGVKDFRGLSKEDKGRVMDLVGIGLAEIDAQGVDMVLDPVFIRDDMETGNVEFAKGWLEKAQVFMAENKRKPKKNEIYQIFVDTYMEN
jgi:hypothetical protein